MWLDHRLSELLQLHLHSRLNTWPEWLGRDYCKTRRETYTWWNLARLLLEARRFTLARKIRTRLWYALFCYGYVVAPCAFMCIIYPYFHVVSLCDCTSFKTTLLSYNLNKRTQSYTMYIFYKIQVNTVALSATDVYLQTCVLDKIHWSINSQDVERLLDAYIQKWSSFALMGF